MRRTLTCLLAAACMDYGVTSQVEVDPPDPDPEPERHPAIQVEPGELDLGRVRRNQQALDDLFIRNIGEATLHLVDLILPASDALTVSPLSQGVLAPGESTALTVSWRPRTYDALDDALTIDHSDPAVGPVTVPIRGEVPAPAIRLTPAHHDFGEVERRTTAELDVIVANDGDDGLRITGLSYASTSDTELFLLDAGPLSSLPVTIPPGASTPVRIRYVPTDDRPDEGRLVVLSEDPLVPEAVASQEGVGSPGRDYDVVILVTADDEWQGWLDGAPLTGANQGDWQRGDRFERRLPSGRHVLALHAYDKARVVAGLIAFVEVDGAVALKTGDAGFRAVGSRPASSWMDPGFDDSAWPRAATCDSSSASTWGTYWPAPFYDKGASWIWTTSNCRALGEAWIRVELVLP
jgi:hypothetical protein